MAGFEFHRLDGSFTQMKRELPIQLANDAQRFFSKSFVEKGWNDSSFEPWPERAKPEKLDRGLLIKSGALRRAVINSAHAGVATWQKIELVVPLPYAAIQNDGGVIQRHGGERTMNFSRKKGGGLKLAKKSGKVVAQARVHVGAYEIKIPARRFMGHSDKLDKILMDRIEKSIDKVFND